MTVDDVFKRLFWRFKDTDKLTLAEYLETRTEALK